MLNELYKKTLKLAAHKKSNTYLAILSFTESSFFPIPPDVMIAPMVIAKKNDYLKIFLIATLFSSLGGILGYFIGSYFFDLGMIGFNLPIFFIICLFSRGLRFFIVSYLSYKFGDIFSKFMKTDAAKWFTILGIIIVLIFTLIYFAIK